MPATPATEWADAGGAATTEAAITQRKATTTVAPMRRTAAILALGLALTGIAPVAQPVPVQAHSCGLPSHFDVGAVGNLTIGAAAEARPVVQVDVAVPKDFELQSVVPTPGWSSVTSAGQLTFKGGPIQVFTCAFFTVTGLVPKKGILAFDITTHAQDGTITHYTSRDPTNLYAAQLVLAGVDPATLIPSDKPPGGKGHTVLVVVGVVILLAGAAVAGAIVVRRRRA